MTATLHVFTSLRTTRKEDQFGQRTARTSIRLVLDCLPPCHRNVERPRLAMLLIAMPAALRLEKSPRSFGRRCGGEMTKNDDLYLSREILEEDTRYHIPWAATPSQISSTEGGPTIHPDLRPLQLQAPDSPDHEP